MRIFTSKSWWIHSLQQRLSKTGGRIRWTQERKTSTWRFWPPSSRGEEHSGFYESLESGSDDNRPPQMDGIQSGVKSDGVISTLGRQTEWNYPSERKRWSRTQVEVAIKTSLIFKILRSFGSTLQWNRKSLSCLFFFFYWILKTNFNIQKKRRKRVKGVPVTASGWSAMIAACFDYIITWLFNCKPFQIPL